MTPLRLRPRRPVRDRLAPTLACLRRDEVLIQAWKKTASHIRHHAWFSDPLAIDWETVRLPSFLAEIKSTLTMTEKWANSPLRIVPAPKSQKTPWRVCETGAWKPSSNDAGDDHVRLRPLAHVALREQVAATAALLCLADRVESLQGNPKPGEPGANQFETLSYGHRLFCDPQGTQLHHRWGSSGLYRRFFTDYRSFLGRPETVANRLVTEASDDSRRHVFIVHSDLSAFYDRVRPHVLHKKLEQLCRSPEEEPFFSFTKQLFHWLWHSDDHAAVTTYGRANGLPDFSTIALPQGLAAAGFFANIVLLDFDCLLADEFGQPIADGLRVDDACRYVDDLRVVVSSPAPMTADCVKKRVATWLQGTLDATTAGLLVAEEKTVAIPFNADPAHRVRLKPTMDRIQAQVSGGFDAIRGEWILETVHSLAKRQAPHVPVGDGDSWPLTPQVDVRSDTAARFCAQRFRTTYRSLRPLLGARTREVDTPSPTPLSIEDLDESAHAFALSLVEHWKTDPSNVRLLRIALDLWPHHALLDAVLSIISPYLDSVPELPPAASANDPAPVAWYCLAEIFAAGATETGIVGDSECLHGDVDLETYRERLAEGALDVLRKGSALPWYLRQQACLFLASLSPSHARQAVTNDLPQHYRHLQQLLTGDANDLSEEAFAGAAVILRRAFAATQSARSLVISAIGTMSPENAAARLNAIGVHDLSFLEELLADPACPAVTLEDSLRYDLCLTAGAAHDSRPSTRPRLSEYVRTAQIPEPLRNELALLRFSRTFLEQRRDSLPTVITPNQVRLALSDTAKCGAPEIVALEVLDTDADLTGSIYRVPRWCPPSRRPQVQLGYLLRFILSKRSDFTQTVRPWRLRGSAPRWGYRSVRSHPLLRQHGFFNSQAGFGDTWTPVSEWFDDLLFHLLRWPGCPPPTDPNFGAGGPEEIKKQIESRIEVLENLNKDVSVPFMLPWRTRGSVPSRESIRTCVLQTVVPTASQYRSGDDDLELDDREVRRMHRNHLASALMAVEAMIDLRASHNERPGVDWLILPELSVHPEDVRRHLFPFARRHRAIVLAGLTYHKIADGYSRVNSAIWVIPELTRRGGLQLAVRTQGKEHLSQGEETLDVMGFRPCQWLVDQTLLKPSTEDQVPGQQHEERLRTTGVICYDATDVTLGARLRDLTDVVAVPALNPDVGTYDRLATSLHYSLYQLVIIANNGQHGGSCAYWPKRGKADREHTRQIFHLHGERQATMAFLDIPREFLRRGEDGEDKTPPAGWRSTGAG